WLPGTIVNNADHPGPGTSELTRDFNLVTDGTFVVDLRNGIYDITLTMGDESAAHDQQMVTLEGELRGSTSTLAGQFITNTYRVVVADGQLTLNLKSPGGAYINSLDVTLVRLGTFQTLATSSPSTGRFAFAIENLDNGFVIRGSRDLVVPGPLCPDGIT